MFILCSWTAKKWSIYFMTIFLRNTPYLPCGMSISLIFASSTSNSTFGLKILPHIMHATPMIAYKFYMYTKPVLEIQQFTFFNLTIFWCRSQDNVYIWLLFIYELVTSCRHFSWFIQCHAFVIMDCYSFRIAGFFSRQLKAIEDVQNALNYFQVVTSTLDHLNSSQDSVVRETLGFLASLLFNGNEYVQVKEIFKYLCVLK